MIRNLSVKDIDSVMRLWLSANLQSHAFIHPDYWKNSYSEVERILPRAEVYVDEEYGQIRGFIGLTDKTYIAGLFVADSMRSKGIGKHLLDYVKQSRTQLSLQVYQKNVGAVKFYRREQFTLVSEQIDERTGETEFVMHWKQIPADTASAR